MSQEDDRKVFATHAIQYMILGDLDKPFHLPECECDLCEQWRRQHNRPTHKELRERNIMTDSGEGRSTNHVNKLSREEVRRRRRRFMRDLEELEHQKEVKLEALRMLHEMCPHPPEVCTSRQLIDHEGDFHECGDCGLTWITYNWDNHNHPHSG